MNMEPWAQRIHGRMTALGLKPTELARACVVKDSSISGWFGRASKPTRMISGDNLVAVARYLRTSPEWIISGKGDPEAQVPTHSQPARLDAHKFHIVARAMQEACDELGVPLNINHRAGLFMNLYERAVSGTLTTGDVVWLGKMLSAAPPGGHSKHGRRDDVSGDQGNDSPGVGKGRDHAKG